MTIAELARKQSEVFVMTTALIREVRNTEGFEWMLPTLNQMRSKELEMLNDSVMSLDPKNDPVDAEANITVLAALLAAKLAAKIRSRN